jgi:hypothetical protein
VFVMPVSTTDLFIRLLRRCVLRRLPPLTNQIISVTGSYEFLLVNRVPSEPLELLHATWVALLHAVW